MFLFPDDIKTRLEFDKILFLLSSYCLGEMAKTRAQSLGLFNNRKKIVDILDEIVEYTRGIDTASEIPLYAYEDITEDLYLLRKEGYVLETDAIFRINVVIQLVLGIDKHFSKKENSKAFPRLVNIADQIDFDLELGSYVSTILESDGNVKADASPELAKINKQILNKERESHRAFDEVLKSLKSSRALSENGEGYKNGRRVLSVLSEFRKRVKGIVHDESASGKTVFIEPESVVFLNNQVFELHLKRKQEIYIILRELCNRLRPFADQLELWLKIIVRLDLIRAKAHFAKTYNGNAPVIEDYPIVQLKNAFHPLLYIKNRPLDLETVPFEVTLDENSRILLISGPNAGGKSITLKTIGLVLMMCQSGLLIPADGTSKLGLFGSFFADIGDQQSVEDDLSTYSSRLRNMKVTLEKSGKKSFVFIDEFGSGTDPKVGGAIAEIILDELRAKKVFGVITTHYSNLKIYAHNTPAVLNGAMHFDKENLKPSYQLRLGKPGSSFAFEIAEKIGLESGLIQKAKTKFGKQHKEIESLLTDLMAEKQALEDTKTDLKNREKMLEKLMSNYDQMKKDLDVRRKRIKLNEKQKDYQSTSTAERDLQKLIKEIREAQNLEKAKKLSHQLREKKSEIINEIEPIEASVYAFEDIDPSNFKTGDFVRMKSGGNTALIKKISKGKAELEMGQMTIRVSLNDLIPANKPIDLRASKSVKMDLVSNQTQAESKLDIRGYIPSDARDFLVEFLDAALISNLSRLQIVHGKGSGVLRNLVREILKDYKDVKKISHPEEEFGGRSITYVDL